MLRRGNKLVARARDRIHSATGRGPVTGPKDADDRVPLADGQGPPFAGQASDVPSSHERLRLGGRASGAGDGDSQHAVSHLPSVGAGHIADLSAPVAARWDPDGGSVPSGLRTGAAWSWRLILLGVSLYLLLQIVAQVLEIVVPVVVALLLAALLQPGADALVRRRWPRALAAVTMLLAGVLVVVGILFFVVNRLVANWDSLTGQLDKALIQLQSNIVRTFPITQHELDQLVDQAQQTIGAAQSAVPSGALSTAETVTQVFVGLLLMLLTLFFFLKDGRSIWLWMIGLMPPAARGYADEAARRSWNTLVSYVRATVAVALIDAVGIGIALMALRVPLAIPLAALVFMGAFIPVIGSFIAAIIAVLVVLVSKGFIGALIALGAATLVMQLEGNVFSPLLLGRAVRIHPLAVVLSIACGAIISGVFGALIAVPLVACLNVSGSYLAQRHEALPPPEPRPDRARPLLTAG